MKIVVCARSKMAFELVQKKLAVSKRIINAKINQVDDLEMLKDYVQYFDADVFVIDTHVNDYEQMILILEDGKKPFIATDEFHDIDIQVSELMGIKEEIIEDEIKIPIEQAPKVEVQIKEVEKEVIIESYRAVKPVILLVGSLHEGAGATTVAMNLAKMIAEKGIDVTYIESPLKQPEVYSRLQIGFQENSERYKDIIKEVGENNLVKSDDTYYYKGVRWIVSKSDRLPMSKFSFEQYNHLIAIAKTTVTIIDAGHTINDEEVQKLMNITDGNYILVEANPIKLDYYINTDNQTMKALLEKNVRFQLILSKANIKVIDIKLLRETIQPNKFYLEMPYISYESLISSIFKLKFYYETEEGREYFEKHFTKVLARHIPKELLLEREKKGLLNFFKKG